MFFGVASISFWVALSFFWVVLVSFGVVICILLDSDLWSGSVLLGSSPKNDFELSIMTTVKMRVLHWG